MTDLNLLPNEVPSVPVICRTLHELNSSKQIYQVRQGPSRAVHAVQLGERRAFVQWRDRQDSAKLLFGDETESLNDQTVFWTPQEITHPTQTFAFTFVPPVLLITSRFQRTSSVSKIFDWSSEQCRFHIGSDITRPSRVPSRKCVLNSKTICRWNNLRTHKESVFQGHTKLALSVIWRLFTAFCFLIFLFHYWTRQRKTGDLTGHRVFRSCSLCSLIPPRALKSILQKTWTVLIFVDFLYWQVPKEVMNLASREVVRPRTNNQQ